MKKQDTYLREYCSRLSDENLKFLSSRLGQKFQGDYAEALDFMGGVREMDRWLGSAETSDELYDMLELSFEFIKKECGKRFNSNELVST